MSKQSDGDGAETQGKLTPPPAIAQVNLSRRIELARQPNPNPADRPKIRHTLGEARAVLEPLFRLFRKMEIAPAQKPQTVMLLPGFGTHPLRMKYMAQQLEKAGHTVKRWGLGFNLGPTEENIAFLEQRLINIHARDGRDVVLVGWSLGGLFARELAKRQPGLVAKVITMGSPFSGNPRSNNAWRIYQFIAGHEVDHPPVSGDPKEKPPVPTIAFWSAKDGIVSARSSCGIEGERDRAVALRCNHIGFSYSPICIREVMKELDNT